MPIYGGYEIYLSACHLGMGGRTAAVLFQSSLNLEIKIIFLYPGGKLVLLDVSSNDRSNFRFVVVRCRAAGLLEVFLGVPHPLVIMDDYIKKDLVTGS